jgi:stage II sporulation protein AB (anti-sigma F factor)
MKQKSKNKMILQFTALSQNECFARQAICAFLAGLDPTLEEISDLRIIISEGVTNCIVHAYRGRSDGIISISVECFESRNIKIKIRDKGCGISNIEQCMQPLFTTDAEGERGGMGLPIIQSLADKLSITSKVGKGTTLCIWKKFSPLT